MMIGARRNSYMSLSHLTYASAHCGLQFRDANCTCQHFPKATHMFAFSDLMNKDFIAKSCLNPPFPIHHRRHNALGAHTHTQTNKQTHTHTHARTDVRYVNFRFPVCE